MQRHLPYRLVFLPHGSIRRRIPPQRNRQKLQDYVRIPPGITRPLDVSHATTAQVLKQLKLLCQHKSSLQTHLPGRHWSARTKILLKHPHAPLYSPAFAPTPNFQNGGREEV
jgi:hypothetical protein